MNQKRILSYCKSQELTEEELNNVSGGTGNTGTRSATCEATFNATNGDIKGDIQYDF